MYIILIKICFSAAVSEDGKLFMWGKILLGGSHDSCFPTPELVKSISGNFILLINKHLLNISLYFIHLCITTFNRMAYFKSFLWIIY